jgi:outer membrane protein assembly factor BamB
VLYVCTRDSYFYAVSLESGKSLQGFKMRGPVTEPPLKVPPYLLLFQHDKGKGVVTAAKVGESGLAERKTWQHLEMGERPSERPSVDAAMVYISGAKGSVFTFGVEVKRDEAPVYDASQGGQDLGLHPPVFLTATEDGRHVYAAGEALKSVEFHQFDATGRLTTRWTFEGKDGWPRPDRASGPVEVRQGCLFLQTGPKSAPGSLLWSIDARAGQPLWCLSLGVGLGSRPQVIAQDRALLRTCDGRLLAALWKNDRFLVEPRDYDVRRLTEFERVASQVLVVSQDTKPLVLFGNHDGLFYAVEQDTGFSAWKAPFSAQAPILSAAAVLGGAAYVCAGPNVYGISLQDGAKLHQFSVDERFKFLATPVVFGDTVIVGNRNGAVYGLKPATEAAVSFLREQWRYETEGPIRYAAVVAGDLVLAGSDDGRIYGLNGSGALVRRWNLGGPLATDPAAQGDRVFIAVRNGSVLCLSPGAEEPVWAQSLPADAVPCSLLLHGKSAFVATNQGEILQLNAADGAVVRTLQAGRTAVNGMAVMGGRLLAASADGHLYFAEGQW